MIMRINWLTQSDIHSECHMSYKNHPPFVDGQEFGIGVVGWKGLFISIVCV